MTKTYTYQEVLETYPESILVEEGARIVAKRKNEYQARRPFLPEPILRGMAREMAKTITVRTYVDGCSHDETRPATEAESDILYKLALSALLSALLWIFGRQVFSLMVSGAVLDETIEDLRPAKDGPEPGIRLTRREKDVARLLIEGLPTKQIAHVLGIGDETVLWYRKRPYAKLDVHSAPAFTAEVLRRGLLD